MPSGLSVRFSSWYQLRSLLQSHQRSRYAALAGAAFAVLAFRAHYQGYYIPTRADVASSRAMLQTLEFERKKISDERMVMENQLNAAQREFREQQKAQETLGAEMAEATANIPNATGAHRVLGSLLDTARVAGLELVKLQASDPVEEDAARIPGATIDRVLTTFRGRPQDALRLLAGVAGSELPMRLQGLSLAEDANGGGVLLGLDLSVLVGRGGLGTDSPPLIRAGEAPPVHAFRISGYATGIGVGEPVLQATLEGSGGRVAVVNGELLREGAQFGDWLLDRVGTGEAWLSKEGEERHLKVSE